MNAWKVELKCILALAGGMVVVIVIVFLMIGG